jgi:ubiquinone/menaquinone biosynthesis C-methylase UbiE
VSAREQAYFDAVVRESGDFNPFLPAGWALLRQRFRELVPCAGEHLHLLDIGCGTGQSRQIYRDSVHQLTGIDLSPVAIAAAQRQFPEDTWLVANALDLPFEPHTFDLITFSSVLHHLDDPIAALQEAVRVLRPGGMVFAYDPNVLHPAFFVLRHPRSLFYLRQGVSPNERPLHPACLRQAFTRAGLDSIQQRCQSNIPFRQVSPRWLRPGITAYNFFDHCWEVVGLGRWMGSFILTVGVAPESSRPAQ